VEDGIDEDQAWAARLDGWIAWELEDFFSLSFVVGKARPRLVSLVKAVMYGGSTYPLGMKDWKTRNNK